MSSKSNKKKHVEVAVEIAKGTKPDTAPISTKAVKEEVVLSKEQQDALATHTSISGKIRYLNSIKIERGAIAKLLNKRYQHVRNVLETPLKRTSSTAE